MSGAAIAMMIVAILTETDTGDSDEAPARSGTEGTSAAS